MPPINIRPDSEAARAAVLIARRLVVGRQEVALAGVAAPYTTELRELLELLIALPNAQAIELVGCLTATLVSMVSVLGAQVVAAGGVATGSGSSPDERNRALLAYLEEFLTSWEASGATFR